MPVYRVVGANDITFKKLEDAISKASFWLEMFGSVWITRVGSTDETLHWCFNDEGLLYVETNLPYRGSLYLGRVGRSLEDHRRMVEKALENYGLNL